MILAKFGIGHCSFSSLFMVYFWLITALCVFTLCKIFAYEVLCVLSQMSHGKVEKHRTHKHTLTYTINPAVISFFHHVSIYIHPLEMHCNNQEQLIA